MVVCDGALPSVPPLFNITVDFAVAEVLLAIEALVVLLINFLVASMYLGLILLLKELIVFNWVV